MMMMMMTVYDMFVNDVTGKCMHLTVLQLNATAQVTDEYDSMH